MFCSVRSSAPSLIRKIWLVGCGRNNQAIGGKVVASATRRGYSGSAWKATNARSALRSWTGRPPHHPSHSTPVHENRLVSHSSSRWGGWVTAAKTATTTVPASIRRTFLSERPYSHDLQGSSPRFTPLEDFCMDALAWTIALGLWYIPFTEIHDDEDGETSDGQDRPLEYREDYGPSVSPWYEKPKHPSGNNKKDE